MRAAVVQLYSRRRPGRKLYREVQTRTRPSDAVGGTAVVSAAVNAKPSEAPLTEEIAQFTLIFQPSADFAVFPQINARFQRSRPHILGRGRPHTASEPRSSGFEDRRPCSEPRKSRPARPRGLRRKPWAGVPQIVVKGCWRAWISTERVSFSHKKPGL